MKRHFWLSVALLALTAPSASAQRTLAVAVGARIRVRAEADSSWRVGRLAGTPPDTVRFQTCDTCAVAAYPLSTTAVEVSVGRKGRSSTALNGAGLGLLAGVGVGFLIGYQANRNCRDTLCGIAYIAVPLGGITGFFLGATAGSRVQYEDWQPARIR